MRFAIDARPWLLAQLRSCSPHHACHVALADALKLHAEFSVTPLGVTTWIYPSELASKDIAIALRNCTPLPRFTEHDITTILNQDGTAGAGNAVAQVLHAYQSQVLMLTPQALRAYPSLILCAQLHLALLAHPSQVLRAHFPYELFAHHSPCNIIKIIIKTTKKNPKILTLPSQFFFFSM